MTGHNSIKMTELADLYRKLGFKDPETFIQSGNVIFSSIDGSNESDIGSKIEKGIFRKFNYIVPVMIRTKEELNDLFKVNPFLGVVKCLDIGGICGTGLFGRN